MSGQVRQMMVEGAKDPCNTRACNPSRWNRWKMVEGALAQGLALNPLFTEGPGRRNRAG